MSAPRPYYTAREIAEKLGISVDTLYRTRGRLHAEDNLPAPITRHRPFKWCRAAFDAWYDPRTRHLLATLAPANDATPHPPVEHQPDELQRTYLHRAYAPAR